MFGLLLTLTLAIAADSASSVNPDRSKVYSTTVESAFIERVREKEFRLRVRLLSEGEIVESVVDMQEGHSRILSKLKGLAPGLDIGEGRSLPSSEVTRILLIGNSRIPYGVVEMQENGVICIHFKVYGDGIIGTGSERFLPGTAEYERLLKAIGGLKHGEEKLLPDGYTIHRR